MCFKEIKPNDLHSFFCKYPVICGECMSKFKPKFRQFSINNYKGISVYDYDEQIENVLFQFKGCYDIELKDVFIARFAKEFHLYFHNYYIVPIPSYYLDDMKREFNHVEEMFSCLKLPILKVITKNQKYKQSDQKKSDRKQIEKVLTLSDVEKVKGKRILLVDDVCTTGSSLTAATKLLEACHPKDIKILVMSKTIFIPDIISKNALKH